MLPTWTISQNQTDTEGTATLTVVDPQLRVLSVSRSTRVGSEPATAYIEFESEPYTDIVALVPPAVSYIVFRITYVDENGLDKTAEAIAVFDPNPPPPPVTVLPDAAGGTIILPFHTTLTRGAVFGSSDTGFPPEEVTELAEFGRRRIDLTGVNKCQGQIHVSQGLPSGGKVAWQYIPSSITTPVEEDWAYLDDYQGPFIIADAPAEIPEVSPIMPLALLARQEVVIRMVCSGGDGLTPLGLREAMLTLTGDSVGVDPGTGSPSDPCQDSTENFGGYDSTAEAVAAGWTNTPDANAGGALELDLTGGVDGSRAIRMDIFPTALGTYASAQGIKYVFTGLQPSTQHRISLQLKISANVLDDPHIEYLNMAVTPACLMWFNVTPGGASDARRFIGEYHTLDTGHFGTPLQWPSDSSGDLTFEITFSSVLWRPTLPLHVWADNIVITNSVTGEMVSPCNGGPTIPGDGGYIPGDSGGPLPPIEPPPETGMRIVGMYPYLQPFGVFPPLYGVGKRFDKGTVIAELDAIRALGYKCIIDPIGRPGSTIGGRFSPTKYLETLNTWTSIDLSSYADIITAFMVIDEPYCAHCWGLTSPIQFSVVDGVLAKRMSEVFPTFRHLMFVRMDAERIQKTGVTPHYVRGCWMQQEGRESVGGPEPYMSRQRAAARALNLRWMWGLNFQNHSYPWRPITPAEIRSFGIPMAQDQEAHGVMFWSGMGQGSYSTGFIQTAPYVSALNDVVAAMTP